MMLVASQLASGIDEEEGICHQLQFRKKLADVSTECTSRLFASPLSH